MPTPGGAPKFTVVRRVSADDPAMPGGRIKANGFSAAEFDEIAIDFTAKGSLASAN